MIRVCHMGGGKGGWKGHRVGSRALALGAGLRPWEHLGRFLTWGEVWCALFQVDHVEGNGEGEDW